MRAAILGLLVVLLATPSALGAWQLVEQAPGTPIANLTRVDGLRLCGAGPDGLYCSGDDGATWDRRLQGAVVAAIVFPSGHVGWAAGGDGAGGVWRTLDAGATWREASPAGAGPLTHLAAFSADEAYVAGRSGLWGTADGGATWGAIEGPGMPDLDRVLFYDNATWFAFNATHTATRGAGGAWEPHALPWTPGNRTVEVRIVGGGDLAAITEGPRGERTLWWSSTDGASWSPFTTTADEKLGSVFIDANGTMFLGGVGYLATSRDGTRWTPVYDDDADPNEVRFRRVHDGSVFAWAASPNGTFAGFYEPGEGEPGFVDFAPSPSPTLPPPAPPDTTSPPEAPPPPAAPAPTPLPALLVVLALAAAAGVALLARRRRVRPGP